MVIISKEMETVVSFSGKVDSSLVSAAAKAAKEMQEYEREMAKANDISVREARAAIKMAKEVVKEKENAVAEAKRIAMKAAADSERIAEKQAQEELRIAMKAAADHKAVLAKRSDHIKQFFKSAGRVTGNILKGMAVSGLAVATAVTVAISGLAKEGIELASDLAEVQNVVSTTFGESENIINDFAQSALNNFGITELNAKNFTGTMGAMFKSMNVGEKDMVNMSTNLAALAGDMGSFYNLDSTDAFEKLRSGISGETEPLKELGINMSVDNLSEFAKAQGETTKFSDMDQAQQAMIRYGFIMEATADAQGDFLRTSDGYANQQRLFSENIKQLSGRVMQGVLPAFASVFKVLNTFMAEMDIKPLTDFIASISNMVIANMPLIQEILPQIANLVLGLLPLITDLITNFLPLATDILPLLLNFATMLMPLFSTIVSVLMPIASILLTAFMDAIGPLIPIITELLVLLTPVLTVIAKIVGFLIKIVASTIGVFLKELVERFKKVGEVIGDIISFFGGKKDKKDSTKTVADASSSMKEYAQGGFASVPSIFGEAGLEAAIPIKPGNPHSIGLLYRAADMLGLHNEADNRPVSPVFMPRLITAAAGGNTNSYTFINNSAITGGSKEEIEPLLKRNAQEVKKIFDDFREDEEWRNF